MKRKKPGSAWSGTVPPDEARARYTKTRSRKSCPSVPKAGKRTRVPSATTVAANQVSSHRSQKCGVSMPRTPSAVASMSPVRMRVNGTAIVHLARRVCQRLRSEEHTSELQSPDHLVCRLLLEKKKFDRTHVSQGALRSDRTP